MTDSPQVDPLPFELPDLTAEAWRLLEQVPPGKVTTYGDLARALGDDKARSARWLGALLTHHHHTADCPCHRVVRHDGSIGLYVTGNPADKVTLLAQEGVPCSHAGRVDSARFFRGFAATYPLRPLRHFQSAVRRQLTLTGAPRPRTIAGLDVAYPSDGWATAAYVLLDADTLETIWSTTITQPVTFPYIPGYLAFRELPLHYELWNRATAAGHAADIVMVDGNGYLHPHRAGIASCFGVVTRTPTIGIGKSLLCGTRGDSLDQAGTVSPIQHEAECIGFALTKPNRARPIYVSPGNDIGFEAALAVTQRCLTEHRVPEPIFAADRLAKTAAQEAKSD